jgi:hypothetical protein
MPRIERNTSSRLTSSPARRASRLSSSNSWVVSGTGWPQPHFARSFADAQRAQLHVGTPFARRAAALRAPQQRAHARQQHHGSTGFIT